MKAWGPGMALKFAASYPQPSVNGVTGRDGAERLASIAGRAARMPILLWVLLATLVMAAIGIANNHATLRIDYGDPDDALRMVQVREFLGSGHWFDTTISRLGGPEGMLSHWSRLIDLPLALLTTMFALVMPTATAELGVRLIWPFLMLVPLLHVVTRTVDSVAGRTTALLGLGLLLACPSALIQFAAGRIDHHNAQNLGAVGAVLLLWSLGRLPNAGRWAGLAGGLAIAIGYEALPLVLVTTAAASRWGLLDRKAASEARGYVVVLAATVAVAFVATTAPARWMDVRCDALALNLVLLLGCGALGMAIALGRGAAWSAAGRFGIAVAGAIAGAVLYAGVGPVCLAGPLAQVPAGLAEIWLVNVGEAQNWLWFLKASPPGAVSIVILFTLALAAQFSHVRRDRRAADAFYLAILIAAVPLAFWQLKYMPYASILAVPPIAILIGRLRGAASISAPTVRFAAAVALNQWTLIVACAVLIPLLTGFTSRIEPSEKDLTGPCYRQDNLAELAALPKGLLLAPVDLGAHLLADTPHAVLAAPYHRIGPAILATHAVLSARTIDEAAALVRKTGATYVAVCPGMNRLVTPVEAGPDSLYARLKRGEALPFLEPVPLSAGSPFKAWRVLP